MKKNAPRIVAIFVLIAACSTSAPPTGVSKTDASVDADGKVDAATEADSGIDALVEAGDLGPSGDPGGPACTELRLRAAANGADSTLLNLHFVGTGGKPSAEKTAFLLNLGTATVSLDRVDMQADASFEWRLGDADNLWSTGAVDLSRAVTPGDVVPIHVRWTNTGAETYGQMLLTQHGCEALTVDVRGSP